MLVTAGVTMEKTGIGEDDGVRAGSAVIQLETTQDDSTTQQQTKEANDILGSLSPLLRSMKLFGLYFTRKSHKVHDSTTSQKRNRRIGGCFEWNPAQMYATIMLAVSWLNGVRYCLVFHGNETLGADLFSKLALIPSALLFAVLHLAYYFACQTGSLDRIFRQVEFIKADTYLKYSLMAKVLAVVFWTLTATNVIFYVFTVFLDRLFNDLSLVFITEAVLLSRTSLNIIKVVFIILRLQGVAVGLFPQAMNFIVTSFLYDQYCQLNEEFSKCIGDRGEFRGNFEQFRRRHQLISRSVQEADRFLMISNVACFCCQIVGIIIVLYNVIFYRHDTVSLGADAATLYIVWLIVNWSSLLMAAGEAIVVNHAVSVCYHSYGSEE